MGSWIVGSAMQRRRYIRHGVIGVRSVGFGSLEPWFHSTPRRVPSAAHRWLGWDLDPRGGTGGLCRSRPEL